MLINYSQSVTQRTLFVTKLSIRVFSFQYFENCLKKVVAHYIKQLFWKFEQIALNIIKVLNNKPQM